MINQGKGMIIELGKKLVKANLKIIRSIAFYPVLICIGFLCLSLLTLYFENTELLRFLEQWIPFLIINDLDIAQNILNTIIGGILSLTVFSFSMVMVVLNQASANFSPRLLPGLISDTKHQVILGVYTGTILFSIIILMSLGSYEASEDYVGFSTMLAAIFGVGCVSIFVYFIHNISQAIQINSIIDTIFDQSTKKLQDTLQNQQKCDLMTNDWNMIYSQQSGYYRGFLISFVSDYFRQQENHVEILVYADQHIWQGTPILKIKENIPKEELQSLLGCLHFSKDRHQGENYLSGMIKLMEVAVRAMSPGVNDPGTASNVITKLGNLMEKALQLYPKSSEINKDNKITFIKNHVTPQELFRLIIQPIRYYAKKDAAVMHEMVKMFMFLKRSGKIQTSTIEQIDTEIKNLKNDVNNFVENEYDKSQILNLLN